MARSERLVADQDSKMPVYLGISPNMEATLGTLPKTATPVFQSCSLHNEVPHPTSFPAAK